MTDSTDPTTTFDPTRDPSIVGSTGTDTNVTDDRRAFTTTFSDLTLDIDKTALDGRLVGLVVPLADAALHSTISFFVSGFASVGSGGSATMWLRAGDQGSKLVSFPPGRDGSYLEQMTYVPAAGQTEVHLTVALLVERSGDTAEQAVLSVESIDANIDAAHHGAPAAAG